MSTLSHARVTSDVSDESDDNAPNQQTSPTTEKKVRSTRACIACRRMKTRCEVDEALGNACKLCIRTRRQCVMQTLPRRRKRKTTDRVTDLEKKIEQLTSLLAATEAGSNDPTPKSGHDGSAPSDSDTKPSTLIDQALNDGLIDWHTACIAFDRYKFQMSRYLPFVVFAADTEAATVKQHQPLLFYAIIVAATSSMHSSSKQELRDLISKDLALRVHYQGERSLELIQCLLVLLSYYARAKHMKELNFNQMVHTAATMGLDVGLGRRSHKPWSTQVPGEHQLESLASRRAWLGCYYSATSISIALRHPAFLRWSVYIEECLDVLTSDPNALPTDKWLCDLIRLQHIAEDASVVFSMDDPGSTITLRDTTVQYQLAGFRQQLEQWKRRAAPEKAELYVRNIEAVMTLYVHEIALHSEHNIDELRSPLRPVEAAKAAAGEDTIVSFAEDLHPIPARIEALVNCLTAIHTVFDSFLSMDLAMLCTVPNLFFVRTGYAARALRKLLSICDSQAKAGTQFPIDRNDLRFEEYMVSLSETFSKVHAANNSQVARAFSMVLLQMRLQTSKADDTRRLSESAGAVQKGQSTNRRVSASNSNLNSVLTQPSSADFNTGGTLGRPTNMLIDPSFAMPAGRLEMQLPQAIPTQNSNQPAQPETYAWSQNEANDAYMSGIEALQWYGHDFMFDDFSTFDFGNSNYTGDTAGWP